MLLDALEVAEDGRSGSEGWREKKSIFHGDDDSRKETDRGVDGGSGSDKKKHRHDASRSVVKL